MQAEEDYDGLLGRLPVVEMWSSEISNPSRENFPFLPDLCGSELWILAGTLDQVIHWLRNGGEMPPDMLQVQVHYDANPEGGNDVEEAKTGIEE